MFEGVLGNDAIKGYLSLALRQGKLGNALLFAGTNGIGKSLFAQEIGVRLLGGESHRHRVLTGNHPDYFVLRTEGKAALHGVDTVRDFCDNVSGAPFEAKARVFIVHDAERMLPTSSNALLKSIEEPALTSTIILLSSAPDLILGTIRSRCRKVLFRPVPMDLILTFLSQRGVKDELARRAVAGARGSIARALEICEEGGQSANTVLEVLARGAFTSYRELSTMAEEIRKDLEGRGEQLYDVLEKERLTPNSEFMTALHKESVTKTIDGAVALHASQRADDLLHVVLAWYRDMHVVFEKGDAAHVMHKEYLAAIEQAIQRGCMRPLEVVEKAVADTRLALARSISLGQALETLFLRLGFL